MTAQKSQPSKYLIKLSQRLFNDAKEQTHFVKAIIEGIPSSQALVWLDDRRPHPFTLLAPLEIQPPYVDRIHTGQYPGRNALHESGFFYVCDFQSILMFAPLFHLNNISSILDLCAAPGGKTVLAFRHFRPQVLLANEAIGKRCGALVSNLQRCQIKALVSNQDPTPLARTLPGAFQLVIVDAPCSGQSLLAKGESAPGAFHPQNVNGCRLRQRRILSEGAKMVQPGGYLLYSTCTYSPEENEEIVEWFLKKNEGFEAVKIPHLESFQSHLSAISCYRFFPNPQLGAGGFSCLLKNTGEASSELPHIPAEIIQWPKPT